MTESERQDMLTKARTLTISAPVLLPLIEKYKKMATSALLAKHVNGDSNYGNLVSELVVLDRFEKEINQAEQIYRTLEGNKK